MVSTTPTECSLARPRAAKTRALNWRWRCRCGTIPGNNRHVVHGGARPIEQPCGHRRRRDAGAVGGDLDDQTIGSAEFPAGGGYRFGIALDLLQLSHGPRPKHFGRRNHRLRRGQVRHGQLAHFGIERFGPDAFDGDPQLHFTGRHLERQTGRR